MSPEDKPDEDDGIEPYHRGLAEFAARYESVSFEDVHRAALPYLPTAPSFVLDVGSGSGRDAAWFADQGAAVVAAEPAGGIRDLARSLHPQPNIRWIDDRLPALVKVHRMGVSFDVIWLSAVWMHLAPSQRDHAFRKLATLLRPGGRLFISLRIGLPDGARAMYVVSTQELEQLAQRYGLTLRAIAADRDALGREGVSWQLIVLELPDDATGALSTLRGIILRDAKSATYKLALLRALTVIADRSPSLARFDADTAVVPLGLVALYWLRMFRPLVIRGLPQAPGSGDQRGLSFAKAAFYQLNVTPFELRPGNWFGGPLALTVAAALRDSAYTIANMPAAYITYPDGRPIFRALYRTVRQRTAPVLLDDTFLWAFGEIRVPLNLWVALRRLATWIEPVLTGEWIRQMQRFGRSSGQQVSADEATSLLRWIDPERDTAEVRAICERLLARGRSIYCTWTDRRITLDELHVDHCFPWSAWPCDDLWNLLPSSRRANLAKRDALISAELLQRKRQRIAEWWHDAFLVCDQPQLSQRFAIEARASLPLYEPSNDHGPDPADMLDAMALLRMRLHSDQQLPEWSGLR